jgi:RHS repeat-associated protein
VSASAPMFFIHIDHLNTPRLAADQNQQTVWKWDLQEPFGSNTADENPSGFGIFDLPLRLPGQYFDKETNLHYNIERNYWPDGGRYVEADPLGIATTWRAMPMTGLNQSYAYANSDPLRYVDELGLAPECRVDDCRKVLDITHHYSGYCPRPNCARSDGYTQWWTCWPYLRLRSPTCMCLGGGGPRG